VTPAKVRVGYVVKRYPRYSETFIVNELLAHEAAGMNIDVFALRPPVDTHFQDAIARVRAPVHYLPQAGLKARDFWDEISKARETLPGLEAGLEVAWGEDVVDVHQALCLARAARERGLEHLHAHFATSPTTVARLAARFAGLSYSFTAHAKDIFHQEVDPTELQDKQRDAAAIVTVSDFNARHLNAIDAGSSDRIVRIYNGLDLDAFRFESPLYRPPRIVAVGRLVEKKGFHNLVEACAILATTGRDFECRILGAGPLEGELRQEIDRFGLEGRVELAGPRPQSEIREELRAGAIMAAPCVIGGDGNRDGLPTTLLEAMALGTPCISTDVTGIPEVLRHEETGLMVPQRDPATLAKSIEHLLENSPERVRLARNARQLIETHFDVTRNAGLLRDVFWSVTRGSLPGVKAVG
jgi:glycosyltransferase involved in cell wall biosynthesis